jgi:hypothetical protein
MPARLVRFPWLPALLSLAFAAVLAQAQPVREPSLLPADTLSRAAIPLDGPWKFHLGDDPAWAVPSCDDSAWEQLTADRPWGQQGYASYAGFAWYRLNLTIAPGQNDPPPLALLVPHVDNAYEIYWNGALVGQNGKLPPYPVYYLASQPPQVFGLGPARSGVLAFRVWKAPLLSDDTGQGGGFLGPPMAGSPDAIDLRITVLDYQWLRSRQFYFALNSLYALVALLSLLAWLRDRSQWPLFWMAGFALAPVISVLFYGLRLPWPLAVANGLWQPLSSLRDISLWFLLVWLLELRDNPGLVRLIRVCAWANFISTTLDAVPSLIDWIPGWTLTAQIADAVFTGVYVLLASLPVALVAVAVLRRRRLHPSRWVVAIFAFLAGMVQIAEGVAPQGRRFTHWTLADKIEAPLFTVNGNSVSIFAITGTLLLVAIVYAVYRSSDDDRRRQSAMEQEFRSARELQQVLIPETLPALPGFSVTSAYLPAQEVGGDFFQIIPMDGTAEGSTLVVLGDVSGKGLKAAMAVSFIVGAVRALANLVPSPAQLLTELNRRLCDRLQGGFATCLVLRVGAQGQCVVASAGHPAPFVNGREINLPGAFPLGLIPEALYDETAFQLKVGQHCALYTDGLLEARSPAGELFGYERLWKLLAGRPSAAKAAEAAVQFGQDDDITVVTLTRTPAVAESPALQAAQQAG